MLITFTLLKFYPRYLALEEDSTNEQFLVDNLGVPMVWIHAAKAVRADYEKNRPLQAYHLLKCHSWNSCHEVLLTHLAAKAIVHGRHPWLVCSLPRLPDGQSSLHRAPLHTLIMHLPPLPANE